jgi:hypothetical protein
MDVIALIAEYSLSMNWKVDGSAFMEKKEKYFNSVY